MSGDESSVVEGASALATCGVTDAVRALRTREEGNEELKARLQKMKVKDVKKVCSTLKVTTSTAGKTALIERLVTYSEMGLRESGEYCPAMALKAMSYVTKEVQDKLSQLPKFQAVPEEKWGQRPACAGEANVHGCVCVLGREEVEHPTRQARS